MSWCRLIITIGMVLLTLPARAEVLEVGPGRVMKAPSAAARNAQDGDTIRIDPGQYYDCSYWRANHITIEAAGPGVVLTDTACGGKALFVINGDDVTIRGLTFTRIRVPDGNGAGIRGEGRGLTIENSRFINNQMAILMGDIPDGVFVVRDSVFTDNGACTYDRCVPVLGVSRVARLEITGSTFSGNHHGDQIFASAATMVLAHNRIEDGAEGSSDNLVSYAGPGSLMMDDNTLEKGPKSADTRAAVLLSGPDVDATLRGNRLANDTGAATTLVLNWGWSTPILDGNVVPAGDTLIGTSGRLRHHAGVLLADTKSTVRGVVGGTRRLVMGFLRNRRDAGWW